jgi:peptide/nickel transport system permease protein
VFAIIGVSMPGFWMGLMLIRYAAVELRFFPPGGFVPLSSGFVPHLQSVCLPSFSLGIYYTAVLSRITRSSMVEVLGQDYVRTAKAMGLERGKVLFYALKNALVPVVSVSAMTFGYMFGWAIIIEQVFNIAGLSRALLTAIFMRDYNTVQGVVLVITTVFIAANVTADILYRLLNPKIRETGL